MIKQKSTTPCFALFIYHVWSIWILDKAFHMSIFCVPTALFSSLSPRPYSPPRYNLGAFCGIFVIILIMPKVSSATTIDPCSRMKNEEVLYGQLDSVCTLHQYKKLCYGLEESWIIYRYHVSKFFILCSNTIVL